MAYAFDLCARSSAVARVAACASALALLACGEDDPKVAPDAGQEHDGGDHHEDAGNPDAAPTLRSVSIDFEARVGSELFECGKIYQKLGVSQVAATFLDNRIYVSDLRLINAAGEHVPVTLDQTLWQFENVALLDFENKAGRCKGDADLNTTLTGQVPDGDYTGVAFKVGLPPKLNHSDTAVSPPPLDLQQLTWGWNAGRVFLTVDLSTVPEGEAAGVPFTLHIGSALCTGDAFAGSSISCQRPNMAEIGLSDYDVDASKIVLDLAAMLQGASLDGDGKGCMSTPDDPDCAATFPKLGIDPATGAAGTGQSVFRVLTK